MVRADRGWFNDNHVSDRFGYALPVSELDRLAALDRGFRRSYLDHATLTAQLRGWADAFPRLVKLASSRLKPGGVLAFETPNPECLAIFATHFYLDPTHQRPIPPGLLVFYFEEFGFGSIEVHRLSPAVESMPALAELPEAVRDAFFGGLDYGIIGTRL